MRCYVEARESQARPLIAAFNQALECKAHGEKSWNENFVPTNEKLIEVLNSLGVSPKIVQLRRMGKFDKDRCKTRTLLVTMADEYDVRLVLCQKKTHIRKT